eukprot:TRINITY_DN13053_c0_g1_i4.p1 TRINITY_DN13053_c0_g1~~TRINITY_DN13053_c0_g1_i4.p1  ORF type:complete len:275 (-),score=53.62 TRINITY_DN13053_c0_g1_i4:10-834(-)
MIHPKAVKVSHSREEAPSKPKLHEMTFTDCINAILTTTSPISPQLKTHFFAMAKSHKVLPDNLSFDTTDSFIKACVKLAEEDFRGIEILLSFLKSDDRVFSRFYPSKEVLGRVDIGRCLNSEVSEERRLGLNFACFLLRYYEDVQYDDITGDPEILMRLRKAEVERMWIDIESLAANQESMLRVTRENQEMTSKAVTELFIYIEEFKRSNTHSMSEIAKDIELLKAELAKTGKLRNSEGRYSVSYTHLRAHETGRNLVCRLLLEKKKKKKKKKK